MCQGCAAPLGIPAHIACGRCGFAAQKALTKVHRAVCGEEKALLRKCNNPLWHFHPCGLQSVVGSPRGNGCIECVSGKSLRTCVQGSGTYVRSKSAKFSYIGVFFHWRIWYTWFGPVNRNLKTIKLWMIIALHRLSIKFSKSLENKGFIAICSPYSFIWFHTSLLFPWLLIRAKSRARKSHNKI